MNDSPREQLRIVRSAAARVLLSIYKSVISPAIHAITPGTCGYQPTCSEYAAIAIAEHGILRGGVMALGRLLRCHPLHRGAFDPVPAKRSVSYLDKSGSAISCVPQAKNR